MMANGALLFPHHVDPGQQWNFSEPVARVQQHPTEPNVIGLQNLKDRPWQRTSPSGREDSIERNKIAELSPGSQIIFGQTRALVT
jgi:hypothetical protein